MIEPRFVSRWTVAVTPRQVLAAWEGKPGLAGTDPPPALKMAVLDELAVWAESALGGLDRRLEGGETYALEGARLPAEGG